MALGIVGAIAVLLLILERWDRRVAALWTALGPDLADACRAHPELRGEIAVWVSRGPWPGRGHVVLDMRRCGGHHVWPVIERLSPRLPGGTTLQVRAITEATGGEVTLRVRHAMPARGPVGPSRTDAARQRTPGATLPRPCSTASPPTPSTAPTA